MRFENRGKFNEESKMNAIKIMMSAAAAATLMGCAPMEPRSILVSAASQGDPVFGAKCLIATPRGQWELETPGAAPVGWASRKEPMRIRCSKDGYRDSELASEATPHHFGADPWRFDGPCADGCRPGPWRNGIPGWTRMGYPYGYGDGSWGGPYGEPDRWKHPDAVTIEMTRSAGAQNP